MATRSIQGESSDTSGDLPLVEYHVTLTAHSNSCHNQTSTPSKPFNEERKPNEMIIVSDRQFAARCYLPFSIDPGLQAFNDEQDFVRGGLFSENLQYSGFLALLVIHTSHVTISKLLGEAKIIAVAESLRADSTCGTFPVVKEALNPTPAMVDDVERLDWCRILGWRCSRTHNRREGRNVNTASTYNGRCSNCADRVSDRSSGNTVSLRR